MYPSSMGAITDNLYNGFMMGLPAEVMARMCMPNAPIFNANGLNALPGGANPTGIFPTTDPAVTKALDELKLNQKKEEELQKLVEQIEKSLKTNTEGVQGGDEAKFNNIQENLQKIKTKEDMTKMVTMLGENNLREIIKLLQKIDPKSEKHSDVLRNLLRLDGVNDEMVTRLAKEFNIDISKGVFAKAPKKDGQDIDLDGLTEDNVLQDKEVQLALAKKMKGSLKKLRADFEASKKDNGWIGKAWDGVKNFIGTQYSSDKTEEILKNYERKLNKLEKSPKLDKLSKLYNDMTGKDLTDLTIDEIEDLLSKEKETKDGKEITILSGSKVAQQVKEYEDGQETATSVGIGTVAVVGVAITAPVSIPAMIGTGIAVGAGAAVTDTLLTDREITVGRVVGGGAEGALAGLPVGKLAPAIKNSRVGQAVANSGPVKAVSDAMSKLNPFGAKAATEAGEESVRPGLWARSKSLFTDKKPNVEPMPEINLGPAVQAPGKSAGMIRAEETIKSTTNINYGSLTRDESISLNRARTEALRQKWTGK